MLDYIKQVFSFNWGIVIIGIVLAVLIFKGLCELWDWFFRRFEIETKSMKKRRENKELLDATTELAKQTAQNLDALERQYGKDEREFREKLSKHMTESEKDRRAMHEEMRQYSDNRVKDREQSMRIQKELTMSMDKLAQLLLDKQISDYRWEIINVADKISNGRIVSKECLKHAIATYDKYEKIIKEYDLVNGEVTVSIGVIKGEYMKVLSDEK